MLSSRMPLFYAADTCFINLPGEANRLQQLEIQLLGDSSTGFNTNGAAQQSSGMCSNDCMCCSMLAISSAALPSAFLQRACLFLCYQANPFSQGLQKFQTLRFAEVLKFSTVCVMGCVITHAKHLALLFHQT